MISRLPLLGKGMCFVVRSFEISEVKLTMEKYINATLFITLFGSI